MKKTIAFILVTFVSCCKNKNNEIIEFNKKGEIVSISYLRDENNVDSIIFFDNGLVSRKILYINKNIKSFYIKIYDKEQNLTSEGPAIDSVKLGLWKFYDNKHKLSRKVEFRKVCDQEYANQEYIFNSNREVDIYKSTFYQYSLKDIIHDSIKYKSISLNFVPLLKDKTNAILFFSTEIDEEFCNINSIKIDTVFSSKYNNNFNFLFNIGFKTKGIKNIRGYISEYYYKDMSNKKYIQFQERKVYFDIPVIVK